jgi:pimeloyl-ACP methyl ester carboxylesterase
LAQRPLPYPPFGGDNRRVKSLVRVQGRRVVAYDSVGSGPPLVCIPGGPGFSGEQLGDLGGLDAFRSLIRLDLRGAGESDAPEVPAWGFDDYAPDIELVLNELGLGAVDLFGHAHGGLLAVAFAASHPDRVRSLVLDGVPVKTTEVVDRQGVQDVSDYFHDFDGRVARYMEAHMGHLYEPALAWFWEHDSSTDFPAMVASCQARTLLVTGDEDPLAGTSASTAVVARMANAELAVIDSTGHFAWLEEPEAYCKAVLEFLDRP